MAILNHTITLSWLKQFYVNMEVQLHSCNGFFSFYNMRLFQAHGSARECARRLQNSCLQFFVFAS